jgi:hypothetical protein
VTETIFQQENTEGGRDLHMPGGAFGHENGMAECMGAQRCVQGSWKHCFLGTRQRAGVESQKSSSSMLEMVHRGTGDVGGYGKL